MKNVSKKSLILAITGLFFLNTQIGLVTQHTRALGTPPSSPKKSAKTGGEKFRGDTEDTYVLQDRMDNGNQSVSFKCERESDGEKCVAKIAINDLPINYDNRQEYYAGVIKILRESFAPRNHINPVVATAPPPTPAKKPRKKDASNPIRRIRPIAFSFDDDKTEDFDDDLLIDEEETLFSSAYLSKKKPGESENSSEKLTRVATFDTIPATKKCRTVAYSGADTDRNMGRTYKAPCVHLTSPINERDGHVMHKIGMPDVCALHQGIMEPTTIDILRERPMTGTVPIYSFRPHIEAFMPMTLKKAMITPLPKCDVLKWTHQILNILIQFNDRGLCHQDIKPDNIFVHNGDALVGDLGLVCDFNKSASMCIGTPAYMAPEVWRKSTRDPRLCDRADVFSLGMTVLEMLTNFRATDIDPTISTSTNLYFAYRDRNQDIAKNIDKYRLRDSGDPIPDNWKSFLRFCLAPNPEDRPTAKQAQLLLKELVW